MCFHKLIIHTVCGHSFFGPVLVPCTASKAFLASLEQSSPSSIDTMIAGDRLSSPTWHRSSISTAARFGPLTLDTTKQIRKASLINQSLTPSISSATTSKPRLTPQSPGHLPSPLSLAASPSSITAPSTSTAVKIPVSKRTRPRKKPLPLVPIQAATCNPQTHPYQSLKVHTLCYNCLIEREERLGALDEEICRREYDRFALLQHGRRMGEEKRMGDGDPTNLATAPLGEKGATAFIGDEGAREATGVAARRATRNRMSISGPVTTVPSSPVSPSLKRTQTFASTKSSASSVANRLSGTLSRFKSTVSRTNVRKSSIVKPVLTEKVDEERMAEDLGLGERADGSAGFGFKEIGLEGAQGKADGVITRVEMPLMEEWVARGLVARGLVAGWDPLEVRDSEEGR